MCSQTDRRRLAARKALFAVTALLLMAAGSVLLTVPASATTVAGHTSGGFAVSPTGAATYTLPIWAPPGPQGMQPQMALTYNSQGGNGTVGVGWGLSGLSAIYRCNLTFAQDAAPAPVALATSDGYCMDGQRLRLTSTGDYGEAGSTYQTEVANFVNVTAYGTAGNGPAYFIAKDRKGRTYTYGDGGNSQVLANGGTTAVEWELNEVSDPAGNTMTISYSTATGSSVPSLISWTPSSHGSTTYNYTMAFGYGANVVPPQGYVGGTSFKNSNLLSSISVEYTGSTVKKYVLTYQTSPTTGRDELKEVQECSDSAGSNCLLPTTITYQNGQAGVSSSPSTMPGVLTTLLYDFNGDGRADAAYFNNGVLYVALNTGSGFGTPIDTGITDANAMYGDLLGTGSDGILANNGGTFYYYTYSASGNSFSGVSTGVTVQASYKYVLTDITGDGLPDLVALFGLTTQMMTIQNTSSGGVVRFGTPYNFNSSFTTGNKFQFLSGTSGHPKPNLYLDFNGDARNDVFVQTSSLTNGNWQVNYYELISNGANAPLQVVPVTFLGLIPGPAVFGNFNDDNCTDVAVNNQVYYSGCNGTIGSVVTLSGSDPVMTAIDWDGDGRTDLLAGNPGSVLNWYHSTGTGFASEASTGYTLASTCPSYPTVADVNGDGLEDLVCTSAYYPHNGAGSPPDLLSSITDGYSNSASPTYVSLVENNYTEHFGNDAAYPDQDYIGPMYVVSSVTFSDPSSSSGGTYNQTFAYYGAWINLQGRGFDSFYTTRTYDSRNALYDYQYFERGFPYTGMKFEDIVSNSTFDPTQWVSTLAPLVTLSSTPYQQRYFAYFSNTTASRREVGGTENGDLITTSSTNYTLDNYGNATSIATTVTDNDPGSPYSADSWTTTTTNTPDVDTTHWCLGLFTETQVAYSSTLSGSNSVTRTKTLTPDTTNCRYTGIVTEPSSSQFKVTEGLAYDSFGNVNSDTVTGVGMTARLTTTNWGTTGQFPMSVTDPSNATTQYNYNFSYGKKSSVTDPNTLMTSWLYADGFGRVTRETRPDGTMTVFGYANCSGSGCLVGPNGMHVDIGVYDSSSNLMTRGDTWADPVDRPLMTDKLTLSGGFSRTDTRYDSLGRVGQKSFPCTYSSFTTPCSYWITNTYDVLNRLTESQRPISSTNSTLQSTTYAYAGRTTTVTDAESNARVGVTDVNGWLRETKDPMGYSVTMAYDSAGSKTKVTDSLGNPLWSGIYSYGIRAFLIGATDMDMGAWGFSLDALGEKTAWTDAKTQSFSETYDALSRPLTRTEPDLFTQWTWGSTPASHNVGKLQSDCTGTGTSCSTSAYAESESYDSLGRLSQRTITLPGYTAFTYTWGYNATTGLLSTLTYPTSTSGYALELQYGYANGILDTVTDVSDTPNVTVWTANTMDPMGHVTQESLGNRIVTNRAYDAVTGWLATAESGVAGGSGVKNLAFLFDEMGNVSQRQDNNLGLTENIYYDHDYRFSYSTLNSTQNLSVTYDGTGNITSRSDVAGGATWTYSTTQKHAVTQAGSSGFQYSYDANGNAITRQGSSIAWSSYNYPTTVNAGSGSTAESVSFIYGPDRQRWQQSYSGNSTTEATDYVGGLLEVVSSGGVIDYRHYINAGGENVAVYSRKSNGTNTFSYLLSDHQASVASITNSTGSQVAGESFTAFGNRRNPTTWSGADSNADLTTIAGITREGYTFQTALGLWMGLNHMNGRVEDSITGRMLSADPHIPNKTNAQAYNRYSYVYNNPVTFADPSGFGPIYQQCTGNYCPYMGATANNGRNVTCWKCIGDDPGVLSGAQLILGDLTANMDDSSDPSGGDLLATLIATSDASTLVGDNTSSLPAPPAEPVSCSPDPTNSNGDHTICTIPVTARDPGSLYVQSGFVEPDWSEGTLPQGNPKNPCPSGSHSSYWSNVAQNFAQTNGATPGAVAPTGTGLFTAGALSQAMWDTNAVTAGRWAFSGFRGVTIGAASFSTLETGVLVAYTAAVNFAATGTAYEVGVGAGSMISAIPTGGGNTVRDSIANGLYDAFGPSSPYDAPSTGSSGVTCGR